MLFQRTFSKVIESVTVEDNDETILQTDKKCHFPYPFSDQTCRPGGGDSAYERGGDAASKILN